MNLAARLSVFIEDEMPETSGMQAKDPKRKYARLPKRLRPNNSRYKARSTLMNTTNPGSTSPSVEQSTNANARHEGQPIASIGRLIQELVIQLADPRTVQRDQGTAKIAKRDVKVKKQVERNARKARGTPEQEYPYNDPEKTRMMRRTSITTSQYGMGF